LSLIAVYKNGFHAEPSIFRHAPRVLLLSRITGREVHGPDGQLLGRLADLTVRPHERSSPMLIERILVRRRGAPDLLVPWRDVESLQHKVIKLIDDYERSAVRSIADALVADELLLVRDVLDTQVVDIAGQRLARVADVVFARTADGQLELVGVEVGFGAVLRRMGLAPLATRTRDDALAWTDLHLTSERGHAVQLQTPCSAVHLLDPHGLALLISRLDTESATEVLAAKEPEVAADVVHASHPVIAERVLRAMPDTAAADILEAMPADRASHWRRRLAHTPALRGRKLLRSHVWPRRRHRPRGVFR
jgi:sporulation protein YlmC with PRC-barrel domain